MMRRRSNEKEEALRRIIRESEQAQIPGAAVDVAEWHYCKTRMPDDEKKGSDRARAHRAVLKEMPDELMEAFGAAYDARASMRDLSEILARRLPDRLLTGFMVQPSLPSAVRLGNVERFLGLGGVIDEHEDEALVAAALSSNSIGEASKLRTVRLLLKDGACSPTRGDALHLARSEGVVTALLLAKADPCAVDKRKGRTPLHYAFDEGSVVALLQAKADPRAVDAEGQTPLQTIKGIGARNVLQVALAPGPTIVPTLTLLARAPAAALEKKKKTKK
jgi:hypothetical protein